jgi:ribonuclease P protein subunit POP4
VRKLKPKPLSAKQKRQLGLLEVPKEQQKFDLFVKLHELWTGYMREILGLDQEGGRLRAVTASNSGTILASADYHGALIEVVRCRCVDRVGTRGIVVRDTKFTFEVVTKQDKLKGMIQS